MFATTYIECFVVVVFGPDEWGLDDVQVSSCHCHWGMSTATERERKKKKTDYNKVKGTAQIVLTDGDIIYSLGEIFMPGHVHRQEVQHHDALDGFFFILLALRS